MEKKILQFTVYSKPISINKAYRSIIVKGRPAAILTSEGKRFKQSVASVSKIAMGQYGFDLITEPFTIIVDYFMSPSSEGDVTNYDKALIDGMKGIVFKDDRALGRNKEDRYLDQGIFFEAKFRKWFDKQSPRTKVKIIFYT